MCGLWRLQPGYPGKVLKQHKMLGTAGAPPYTPPPPESYSLKMDGLGMLRTRGRPGRHPDWSQRHQRDTSREIVSWLLTGIFEDSLRDNVGLISWYLCAGALKAEVLSGNRQRCMMLWKLESRGCGGTPHTKEPIHTKEEPPLNPSKPQMSPDTFVV